MKTIMKIPELLSPAGSPEMLRAAVENGCDAVYMGGSRFNARASADNFDGDALWQAIDYCHLRGVKVYLTLNTLYHDDELSDVFDFAKEAYRHGADAFIVQDFGMGRFLSRHLPDLPLHASTQMTAHSVPDIVFLRNEGFKRVVLAREASLPEAAAMSALEGMETEVFIHGALCVSYSGQCLFSSFIGGRSGNRGRCAQPCRQRYQLTPSGVAGHLLSPKDMMTLPFLAEIVSAGVVSLKIEGRMRGATYAALTTRVYREALHRIADTDNKSEYDYTHEIKKLAVVFSRGGDFSKGYFNTHSSRNMMSTHAAKATGIKMGEVTGYDRTSGRAIIRVNEDLIPGDGIEIHSTYGSAGCGVNKKVTAGEKFTTKLTSAVNIGDAVYRTLDKALLDEIRKTYVRETRRLTLAGQAQVREGEPTRLSLYRDGITVTVYGAAAEPALKQPLTAAELIRRLEKTGDGHFNITATAVVPDGLYLNIKDMNELRRKGLEAFETEYLQSFRREVTAELAEIGATQPINAKLTPKKLTVSVTTIAQLNGALTAGAKWIYFEATGKNITEIHHHPSIIEKIKENGIQLYAALPRVNKPNLAELITTLERLPLHGYLARTWGQLVLLQKTNKEIRADYPFNVMNRLTAEALSAYASHITLSPELSLKQLQPMDSVNAEVIVYGRMPFMLTRQCPVGLYHGNKTHPSLYCQQRNTEMTYHLTDQTGKSFPLLTDCENCLCLILNADTTDMLDCLSTWTNRPSKERFAANQAQSTLESAESKKGTPVQAPLIAVLPQTALRLMFTTESKEETLEIIKAYQNAIAGGHATVSKQRNKDRTHGHFFRGVT